MRASILLLHQSIGRLIEYDIELNHNHTHIHPYFQPGTGGGGGGIGGSGSSALSASGGGAGGTVKLAVQAPGGERLMGSFDPAATTLADVLGACFLFFFVSPYICMFVWMCL